jgi:hypothetical protein
VKIHPRTRVVDSARHEFELFMLDLERKYDLTYGEMFAMLGHKIEDLARSEIRAERHPGQSGKGGDEA